MAFNVNLNSSKTNSASLLALANVEALAEEEEDWVADLEGPKDEIMIGYSMDRVLKNIKIVGTAHAELCPYTGVSVAQCGCSVTYELQYISCFISHWYISKGKCNFKYQSKDC